MDNKPAFLITIDTEGDNLWAKPEEIVTENAKYLLRFQILCERFGFKPTYLTNYEMALDPVFQRFGKQIIKNKSGEIGMHLHPWNMPPCNFNLTKDDLLYQPYLIEYPAHIIEEKINFMTVLLENVFEEKMLSHRAGRWGFNEKYAELLVKYGYKVDCSVTPNISWKEMPGVPEKKGGPDYTNFRETPYFLNLKDISKEGKSCLLEVPMTIKSYNSKYINYTKKIVNFPFVLRMLNYLYPENVWLRPGRSNLKYILKLINQAVKDHTGHLEFMLHSSELMPEGSPYFKTPDSIDMLYANLERIFAIISKNYEGCTLSDFYFRYVKNF